MQKFLLSITTIYLLSSPMLLAQDTTRYWSLSGNSNATTTSKLGTTNDVNLRFYTKNVLRMIINSVAGNVGIGMGNPTSRLQINCPAGIDPFRVQLNTSTKLMVHSSGGVTIGAISTPPPNNSLYVSGSVGIGTPSPSAKLHVIAGSGTGVYAIGGDVGVVGKIPEDQAGTGVVGVASDGTGGFFESFWYTGLVGSSHRGIAIIGGSDKGEGGVFSSNESDGLRASTNIGGYAGIFTNGWGIGVRGESIEAYGGDFYSSNSSGLIAGTGNGTYAAEFNGKVYATGGFTTSDKNLKKNIQEFADAMSIIKKLKPQNYEFKNDVKYASLNLPKGIHYGLMAQDLEQVLPNLVLETPHQLRKIKPITVIKPTVDGKRPIPVIEKKEIIESINIKAVNYVELIPIMIKAMQEQEVKMQQQEAAIQEQNAKIEVLTQLVNKLSVNPSVKVTGAFLGQSTPNPNNTTTRITYNIPAGFSKAELVINNEAGHKVKQIQLTKSGLIDLDTSRLSAGTYFYTLFVNGTSVDTKKMIVTR